MIADPPLKQVVSRTVEAGLRGSYGADDVGHESAPSEEFGPASGPEISDEDIPF